MAVWQGIPYTLTGPDNAGIAVLNDRSSPWFVGYLTEPPAGLDGPPIRERARQRVDASGGVHGLFLQDRRPVVLTGIVMPSGVQATDEIRQNQLLTSSLALGGSRASGDLELTWTESQRGDLSMLARTQLPTRIGGRIPKTFTVSLVAADYRIRSSTIEVTNLAGGNPFDFTLISDGNAPTDWDLELLLGVASSLDGLVLEWFTDAARTVLVSRTEFVFAPALVASERIHIAQGDVYRAYNALGYGEKVAVQPGPNFEATPEGRVDRSAETVFHPLMWEPAPAPSLTPTAYGRFTKVGLTGTLSQAKLRWRHQWSQ